MPCFAATYRHRDLLKYRVPASGVRYSAIFEWLQVARSWGMTVEQWLALPVDQQAMYVAHHRIAALAEAVPHHEQMRETQRSRRG